MRTNYACVGIVLFGLTTAATPDSDWQEPEHHDEHDSASGEESRIDVECRAQNDFGYIASASGTLQIGSRTPWNSLTVSGTLEIDARYVDADSEPRHVQVQGTVDVYGQYVFADVISGADDLASVFFAFGANSMSNVQSKDGIQYQTECSASEAHVPRIADIALTKKLRFSALADGTLRAQVEVLNVGNAPVTGPATRIRIAGLDVSGTLYDTTATKNALDAGEQGYIEADLPANTLARCGDYPIILDLDHTLQSGAFDPFANDSGTAATACLRWNTPITDEALGAPADPILAYKTLEAIVNSQVIVRKSDNQPCSTCHYAGSGKPYSPPPGTITPSQVIGGRAWSGYDGWANEFYNQPSTVKPDYLKQVFRRWLDDGGL